MDKLKETVEYLIYLINNHKLKTINELKKYIYTHNIKPARMLSIKKTFKLYGELNVYNCIFLYKEKVYGKEKLINRIKSVIV